LHCSQNWIHWNQADGSSFVRDINLSKRNNADRKRIESFRCQFARTIAIIRKTRAHYARNIATFVSEILSPKRRLNLKTRAITSNESFLKQQKSRIKIPFKEASRILSIHQPLEGRGLGRRREGCEEASAQETVDFRYTSTRNGIGFPSVAPLANLAQRSSSPLYSFLSRNSPPPSLSLSLSLARGDSSIGRARYYSPVFLYHTEKGRRSIGEQLSRLGR